MEGDHHHIVAFFHPSLSALCHEPWSQLFLIPSSPPSMLSLIAGSSSTSFSSTSRTEYVPNHHSIAKCLKLSFQWVVIHPDRTPNKRVTPFLLCWCKLSQADFRMCDTQRFSCNFLHRSPKMLILDALESRLNRALEHLSFPFFYISEHVLNLDENSSAPFGILEVLMILISAFITNSWEWLLTVYFGAPSMFITLWFGFDYGTNPPLGTLII
jgi:hypothetical protein